MDLSLEDVAERVGNVLGSDPPTKATVSRWRGGGSVPDLDTIAAIALALGVDAPRLAFGDWVDPEVAKREAAVARAARQHKATTAAVQGAKAKHAGKGKRRRTG